MKCPKCGYKDSKVVDSRPTDDLLAIRRRRECFKCEHRFTTYERMEEKAIVVTKKNGSAEVFDSDKLLRGVLISCAKRPVERSQIEGIIQDIVYELRNNGITEIKSVDIGEMVLDRLADVDDVAYVRFASVYKDFDNVGEFKKVLKDLK